MTATEYGVKVTEIIDNATGGNFEYPESFENEVAGFFRDRLPAQIAAESVMADVFSKEESPLSE